MPGKSPTNNTEKRILGPRFDKNLETRGLAKFPSSRVFVFGRVWMNKIKREETSSSESRRPVNILRVRVASALREFFLGLTNPEVAHLTNIERMALRPETEAQNISELKRFANFARVPTVADVAALELDSKLVKIFGRPDDPGSPQLASERVSLDGETFSNGSSPRVSTKTSATVLSSARPL